MIEKDNRVKTVFKTKDTVYKYYPDSYGSMESSYEDEKDSVDTAEQMLLEMAFMDKRAFDKTGDNGWACDPLRFVHSNFDELMDQYNDAIFRMLDAKLSLECAEASGDKYNYFGEDVPERTLTIEEYKVNSLHDIEALRVLMRNEEHDIKWELMAICASNPEQITPSTEEPLSYVRRKILDLFERLRSVNTLLLKLLLMDCEMFYGWDEIGMMDAEKEKRYFSEKVEIKEEKNQL